MIEILIKILERLGLPADTLNLLILAVLIAGLLSVIIGFLWKLIKWIILFRNQEILNNDLTPYFSKQDVDRATRYFIPTRYQNVSPSDDEEPGRKYIASAQEELIPLFLKKIFSSDGNKYYLILADTGMGKTTFLINLYLQYKNQWKNFFTLTKSYDIVMFPLGHPDALQEVEKIQDKRNTILLLDAFDEDVKALDNHKERMNEILSKVHDFREVVITCRTQFFPSQEEEPHFAGYYSFGESGEYKFQKLYLSVFDNKDVKRYLKKRFSIFSIRNYLKAKSIIQKIPNLVVRPMLLSRIDDLLDSDKNFEYTFQIYEVMIEKWIERESKKRGIREKYGSSENYQKLLYQFSRELALDLYRNKKKRGGYLISKDEEIALHSEIQIADIENEYKQLSLTEKEARSQSLLNRNSSGQYKFSHKSFFEYFLAKEMFNTEELLVSFDFEGMNAAKNFFEEMALEELFSNTYRFFFLWKKGQSGIQYRSRPKNIKEVKIVEVIQLNHLNPLLFSALTNLDELIIVDTKKFSALYCIYKILASIELLEIKKLQKIVIKRKQLSPSNKSFSDDSVNFYRAAERLKGIYRLKRVELLELINRIELLELLELLRLKELRDLLENQELQILREHLDKLKHLTPLDRRELLQYLPTLTIQNPKDLEYSFDLSCEYFLNKTSGDLMNELTMTNSFLKDMQTLRERLPNCKMYY